ncbi:alpha-amylase family glycosyl hydrolase [Dyella mobilis]|uniref:Alpha-amylase n=1 Tax=Dyella mobilis TaxID=1849582 RepID=A0ABS2KFK5_9GAMM|nr:alpha-amylase family glycosyl hydrolase [Dyella mobilis]MBM7129158.1 alpha-glucosidase C-terminal domain-containing protein [Dyella mobilis]GLQ98452.1 alpha-amylase [Dyella mobilis]
MPRFYAVLRCAAVFAATLLWSATSLAAQNVAAAPQSSGVYYEIFVRAFYDTNGDGVGDLNGVTAKLDYIKSLGVSGIWLMPINPSPTYHGYDITDYEGINPQYGTMQDFKHLLDEAHKRGIKVIMDMVINHTSDQHPWFKAAQNPKDPHHDWYVWAKPGSDLKAISATGGPAWHRAPNGQYYVGVFTGAMPDLNYDNPAVRKEMIDVGRFWLRDGVDGFRLDAAQHIYDDLRTDIDSPVALKKNIAWWTEYRRGLQAVDPNVWLVGEVARHDPDDLTPYLGPLNTVFNFPVASQLIESVRQERNLGIGKGLQYSYAAYRAHTDGQFDDAPFLSNHDQDRVMSQLEDNAAHVRLAAALLLTLPGHPFIYYGEELGMQGAKPDEDIREPMRWYRAGKGPGVAQWKPWSTSDGPDVSVEAEQADPDSLLNLYRKLIGWREQVGALRDGVLRNVPMDDPHVLAYTLQDAHSRVLVVHNLSRDAREVPLDESAGVTKVLLQSKTGVTLAPGKLGLPPYGTAILQ